jgi:hypothetical protein
VIAGFNKPAADVLGLSPPDVGRALSDIAARAGLRRLEQQCSEVITVGVEVQGRFRDGGKQFVVRYHPTGEAIARSPAPC